MGSYFEKVDGWGWEGRVEKGFGERKRVEESD